MIFNLYNSVNSKTVKLRYCISHKKAALRGGCFIITIELRAYSLILTRFGDDLLSHALRRSTISATALNGRVRDGIGCFAGAMITKPRKD